MNISNITYRTMRQFTRGLASAPDQITITPTENGSIAMPAPPAPVGFNLGVIASTPLAAGVGLTLAWNASCTADPGALDTLVQLPLVFTPSVGAVQTILYPLFLRDLTYETAPQPAGTKIARVLADRWIQATPGAAWAAIQATTGPILVQLAAARPSALDFTGITLKPGERFDCTAAMPIAWIRGLQNFPGLPGVAAANGGTYEQAPALATIAR